MAGKKGCSSSMAKEIAKLTAKQPAPKKVKTAKKK